jgi:hypothetical protein
VKHKIYLAVRYLLCYNGSSRKLPLKGTPKMAQDGRVALGVRVHADLKETLQRQARDERRSLRTVVETILERALAPAVSTPQAG